MTTESLQTDELLSTLRRLRSEFNAAADALFWRWHVHFVAYAVRQGLTREEAEDAAQGTFTKLVTGLEHYRGETGEAWLWQIHANTVRDALRRRETATRHLAPLGDGEAMTGSKGSDPEAVANPPADEPSPTTRDGLLRCLVVAFEQLSADEREELKKFPGRRGRRSRLREAARARFRTAYRSCSGRDDELIDTIEG